MTRRIKLEALTTRSEVFILYVECSKKKQTSLLSIKVFLHKEKPIGS